MTALEQELIALRREFHRYPESGWTEFRTTVRIIEELEKLGLPVHYGKAIHEKEKMYGMPSAQQLELCWQRAKEECGREDLLEAMRGGYTGCGSTVWPQRRICWSQKALLNPTSLPDFPADARAFCPASPPAPACAITTTAVLWMIPIPGQGN